MKKKAALETAKCVTTAMMNSIKFRTDKPGFFQLSLHVKPGAKQSRVAEVTDNFIGVQISAPPREGEANEEVLRYFAEIFKLKQRHVSLISGMKSRDKIILVENVNNLAIPDIKSILEANQN